MKSVGLTPLSTLFADKLFVFRWLAKVGARVVYNAKRFYVDGVSAFSPGPVLSHLVRLTPPCQRATNGVEQLWEEVCRKIAKISLTHV